MSEHEKNRHQNEGALRILEAIGAADEELLARCGVPEAAAEDKGSKEKRKRGKVIKMSTYKSRQKPLWRQGRAWAACLGLLAVGFLSWNGLRFIQSPAGEGNSGTTGSAGFNNAADQTMDGGAFTGSIDSASTDSAPMEDFAVNDTGASRTENTANMDNGGIDTAATEEVKSEEGQTGSSEDFYEEKLFDIGCPENPSKEVTEEEARSWMPLGAYIPQNLPAGYSVDSASINETDQTVTMTWRRGRDYMLISVSMVEPGTVETVDVSEPETYDERLYEIPYSETVPREYRETFDHPVFAWEDLNSDTGLELMSSRMRSHEDAGDTNTPRGNFYILMSDEVLLHFNGRGTPEEIWAMFYSMKR